MQKPMPYDEDAEMSVLSCCIQDEQSIAKTIQELKPEDFYHTKHQIIYKCISDLFGEGQKVSIISVNDSLKKSKQLNNAGGLEYINDLDSHVPTTSVLDHNLLILKNKKYRREIIKAADDVARFASDDLSDDKEIRDRAEKFLFELTRSAEDKSTFKIGSVLPKVFDYIEKAMNSSSPVTGIATGFSPLDQMTGGLHNTNLSIIAARPGMGKTALALNIATNVAMEGTPVLFFSMEMSKEELTQRVLCSVAEVDSRRVSSGVMGSNDYPMLTQAGMKIQDIPIYIDDQGSLTPLEIRSKSRQKKVENNIGLIIVDYIQLMHAGKRHDSRVQEVSEISRNLKALAKDIDVPVIALSQLNRSCENRTDKRPLLSDLRESGSIEQDADNILFLYRDEYYNPHNTAKQGVCEVLMRKQRNGPIGDFELRWDPTIVKFSDAII